MHKYFRIWLLSWRWHDWKKLPIQLKFHLNSCVYDSCHSIQSIILVYFHLPLESFSRESWESVKGKEKTESMKRKKNMIIFDLTEFKKYQNSLLRL